MLSFSPLIMWFLLIYLQIPAIQAQNRIALRGPDSPCKGRLEVYHDGRWGPVCSYHWSNKNGEVACKSLGCGKHERSGRSTIPIDKKSLQLSYFWMNEVNCTGMEDSLWKCPFNGWGITQCFKDTYVEVECSGTPVLQISLNDNENITECAGAVLFKTETDTTSVCHEEWDADKANRVCNELKCGKHFKIPKPGTFHVKQSSYRVPLRCIGNETFSWQCVDWVAAKSNTCQKEANVICSDHKMMRLKGDKDNACQGILEVKNSTVDAKWIPVKYPDDGYKNADDTCSKLRCGKSLSVEKNKNSSTVSLNCTDRVEVGLSHNCYGEVYVKVNETKGMVCSNGLSDPELKNIGKVVCKQLKCSYLLTVSQGSPTQKGLLSQVDCSGNEDSLWECLAKHEPRQSCTTTKVTCADFENASLKDGFSSCSGRLEVKFEGQNWTVQATDRLMEISDVVCKQLGCGDSAVKVPQNLFIRNKKLEVLKWSVDCKDKPANLSQCLIKTKKPGEIQNPNTVNVFCKKEELWFLEGNKSCEGTVGVESAGKRDFLTEVDYITAEKVCKQLFCGPVESFSHKPNTTTIPPSYLKSSNLSQENSTTLNETSFANVKCQGSVEVKLHSECWGKVMVCRDEMCGGVCKDTWTKEKSDMLCENLGCGKALVWDHEIDRSRVTVASIHCSSVTQKLSQCNFVPLEDPSLCENAVNVFCTGSLKVKFKDTRYDCAGRVELFYLGKWHPMCTDGINKETQNIICQNQGCGDALKIQNPWSFSTNNGLGKIACTKDIETCNFNKIKFQRCSTGHITCQGWRNLLLNNDRSACSGEVYAEEKNGLIPVSNEGWTPEKREELCQYLQCGNSNNKPQAHSDKQAKSYKCSRTSNDTWKCDDKPEPFQHLSIECNSNPEIKLLNGCVGEVQINQDGRMCWNQEYPTRIFTGLCQQMGCSTFFRHWNTSFQGKMHHFRCGDHENLPWQCSSWKDNCDKIVNVACAKSIGFQFSEECGGQLEIHYGDIKEPVCVDSRGDADVICKHMKCGNGTSVEPVSGQIQERLFSCNGAANHPMHCVKDQECTKGATIIKCEKYKPAVKIAPPSAGLIAGLSVGLLFLLVAAVIVIWQRKRFIAILRLRPFAGDKDIELSSDEMQDLNAKNSRDLPDRKSSVFDMDDYDDVDSTVNPVEDESNSQELQSAEDEEEDSEDSSGTEYDDIEERDDKALGQENSSTTDPLLPPRPANLLDDVKYEVEVETPDDYDDAISAQDTASPTGEGPVSETNVPADLSVVPDD